MELDLRDGHVFFLRTTYGDDAAFDVIGRWTVRPDGSSIELARPGADASFSVEASGALRLLDSDGNRIDSELDYELRRDEEPTPFEPSLELRGMFTYFADAAVFRECITGLRLPVAMEGDYPALEDAYLAAPKQDGHALLAEVEGRLAERPEMEGDGVELALVPQRFLGLWPRETCGEPLATAELTNTYWRLVRLDEEPVVVAEGRREPHMRLVAHHFMGEVKGSGGCNSFSGRYELADGMIHFRSIGRTKMDCKEVMEQEDEFLRALGAPVAWRIEGDHLELLDAGGKRLAVFEAAYPE